MPSYSPGDTLLDKYIIQSLLGQGAFGEVYLVTHLMLGVPRAVKVLRSDAPGIGSSDYSEAQSRFRLEAQLGAQIHPHLLLVHDCFISEKISLLEMEYAAGGSLAARLQKAREDKQPFEVEQALRIAAEIAEGLAALHEHDYVHRDLKPSNILFDEHGQARVADLGLTQVPGGPSLRSQLSEPRAHPGTPAYMSPEQESSGKLLTPPSDIYALGLVLFEMLTGRNYRLLKPGTRAASLREDLPQAVDDLLAKMLAKTPEERPWNGAEAAGALKAVQAEAAQRKVQVEQKKLVETAPQDQPVPAKPGKGFLARNWGWLALAVLLVILLLAIRPNTAASPSPTAVAVLPTQASTAGVTPSSTPLPLVIATSTPLPSPTTAPTETALPSPTPILRIGSTWLRPADGMVMMYVPAGPFTMGAHKVTLSAYWIDQTDVTNSEYAKCVQAGGCQPHNAKRSGTRPSYYGNFQFDNFPVIHIDWNQAKTYCDWTGARLLTEAEWEKAARGIVEHTYPWGEIINQTYANYNNNVGDTTAVCSYPEGNSQYGVCDMAGNVWQWVADWYDSSYYDKSPASNPTGPANGQFRVVRGGGLLDDATFLRSYYRDNAYEPSAAINDLGFRCARSQ